MFCQKAAHENSTYSQKSNCNGVIFSKGNYLWKLVIISTVFTWMFQKFPEQLFRMTTLNRLSLTTLFGEYWILYLKAYNLWIFKWYLKHQLLPVVYFQVPNISILSLQTDRNHTFHCMLIYWKHASFETDNSMGFPICCNCDIHWRFFWVEWSVTLLDGYQFHCEGLQGE